MTKRSKLEPEVEILYGNRLFSETGSSYYVVVNWLIISKFSRHVEFDLCQQVTYVTKTHLKVPLDFDFSIREQLCTVNC